MEPYVRRVLEEANDYPPQAVQSIYFGGGTPTVLPAPLLVSLLEKLRMRFPCDGEITIEANPATVNLDSLRTLRDAGFSRISIGVQSLHDHELSALGRLHSAEEAVSAIRDAYHAGFSNISADVMFGHPAQTVDSVSQTVRKLLSLPITHISTYSLSIEEGTAFAENHLVLPDEEAEREMYYAIRDILEKNGLIQYEISNFAKPNMKAVHNSIYWDCGEYIGLGAGAHGYVAGVRYANTENLETYLASPSPIVSRSHLTAQDMRDEYYMLGLRRREGVKDDGNPKIPILIQNQLLEKDGDFVRLTKKGMDLANYVIAELCT